MVNAVLPCSLCSFFHGPAICNPHRVPFSASAPCPQRPSLPIVSPLRRWRIPRPSTWRRKADGPPLIIHYLPSPFHKTSSPKTLLYAFVPDPPKNDGSTHSLWRRSFSIFNAWRGKLFTASVCQFKGRYRGGGRVKSPFTKNVVSQKPTLVCEFIFIRYFIYAVDSMEELPVYNLYSFKYIKKDKKFLLNFNHRYSKCLCFFSFTCQI